MDTRFLMNYTNFQEKVEQCFAELKDNMKAWIDDLMLHANDEAHLICILRRFFDICGNSVSSCRYPSLTPNSSQSLGAVASSTYKVLDSTRITEMWYSPHCSRDLWVWFVSMFIELTGQNVAVGPFSSYFSHFSISDIAFLRPYWSHVNTIPSFSVYRLRQ